MASDIQIADSPVLTNLYRGYVVQDSVLEKILPVIKVGSRTGQLKELGTEHLRLHNAVITGKSGTRVIETSATKGAGWHCVRNGLRMFIDKETAEGFNIQDWKAGQAEARKMFAKMLKDARYTGREYALSAALVNTSVVTNYVTLSGGTQLDKYATSKPLEVAKTARLAVYNACGNYPNAVVMGVEVFEALRDHPDIKKTVGVAGDGTISVRSLTEAEIAKSLNVDKIIVGKRKYNSAKEGQTAVMTAIWGKTMTFMYINPNPSPERYEYSLGYTFELAPTVVDYKDCEDPIDTQFVRINDDVDDMLIDAAKAAYTVLAAVA